MPSKGQQAGMRAVYLVAAELVERSWIVSPTARNAFGADLLVINGSCNRAYFRSGQVKRRAPKLLARGREGQAALVPNTLLCVRERDARVRPRVLHRAKSVSVTPSAATLSGDKRAIHGHRCKRD
jgi:hypothetical protein